MPILQSHLNKHWYYRLSKVIVLLLPILVVASAFFAKEIPINRLSNATYGWAVGLMAYYVTVAVVWRMFLYIFFGGLQDDTKKKAAEPSATPTVVQIAPAAQPPVNRSASGVGIFLFMLIMFIFIAIAIAASQSSSSGSSSSSSTTTKKSSTRAYCNPGNTYNYSSGMCCPNSAPHYYNGAHGISGSGCYASCPYIGDCSEKTTRY